MPIPAINKYPSSATPEKAASFATIGNGAIATTQLIAAGATGNVGFFVESTHNLSDAFSFHAKKRAMEHKISEKHARNWRMAGAIALTGGGIAGIVGGTLNAIYDRFEVSDTKALVFAVGAAAVNGVVAYVAHGSEDHDHTEHDGHHHSEKDNQTHPSNGHRHGAHAHTKLHAFTDAGTGFVYAGALFMERYIPGIANYAVVGIGAISAGVGTKMINDVHNTPSHRQD